MFLSLGGWWTPELLDIFRTEPVTDISLTSSVHRPDESAGLVGRFFQQGCFTRLTRVSLASISLSHTDLSALRLLPAVSSLNLASTGIDTYHLLHMISHAHTLRDLNLSSNLKVTDDSRVPLSALPRLSNLYLRDTGLTMPCLRLLVYALPSTCRFVTVPQGCLDYLNDRSRFYCQSIPAGYIQDPRHVPHLTVPVLRKNLELHKRFNRDIIIGGGKAELVEKLMGLLCGRIADGGIAKRIGRGTVD